MIDRIIELSIRRRGWVIAAGVLLAAWGLFAVSRTPVDAIPDLSEEQVIVSAEWPGHSPRELDDQVTYPLSVELRGLRGVRVVRASSDVGYAWLAVILDDGVDFDATRRALAERVASAALPEGVVPRLAPDVAATGQIFWYTVESRDGALDLGQLRALQDSYVKPRLAAVPGVAEVASVGGAAVEYQVNLDPIRLRAFQIGSDAVARAVADANATAGAHVIHKGNAEFIVRGVGALGARAGNDGAIEPGDVLRDLERAPIALPGGGVARVGEVAKVALGAGPRRGVLEKDGAEVTGGVVLMSRGENPRAVTLRIKAQIQALQSGLPAGVRILPFYDRTPLIDAAVGTVAGTLLEAIVVATICVWLILLHLRVSLIIAITLPLAALASFAAIWLARVLGLADVETNIMSLAGIAISIGVLTDSSIVMAENVMHTLREHFGDEPVRGDVRALVLPACREVGRPIFFSVAIMLLSFLPVFALGGMEGKMFRPLAFTKCCALVAVAVLSITLVPALCTIFIKGRLRDERDSPIVRGVVDVYRPVLDVLLRRPAPLFWLVAATFVVGTAPVGSRALWLGTLFLALVVVGLTARGVVGKSVALAALLLVAIVADRAITPLEREFMTPLDEGMVMDMPITVPRASITESRDDLFARDMILCRFPEVDMVVGKAGRAETPTDPAPLDMIETMVNFRPRALWPKRKLMPADAARQTAAVCDALVARGLIAPPADAAARARLLDDANAAAVAINDALIREYAYQRNQEFARALAADPARVALAGYNDAERARWSAHVAALDGELIDRAAHTFTRVAIEELLARASLLDPTLAAYLAELKRLRGDNDPTRHHHAGGAMDGAMSRVAQVPASLPPRPDLDEIQAKLSARFARGLMLWKKERADLVGFGGDLDRAVPMPGWTNVWTMPIQNRVDMLATGVNTMLGVRVIGRSLNDVVDASEAVAAVLKRIPGAADVVADPIRGKGYVEVRIDRDRAARLGVSARTLNDALETAIAGQVAATSVEGRARRPVRVRYARDFREDDASIRAVLVPATADAPPGRTRLVPLSELAEVRVVEGPATIKSENGLLRNYVRLNVRGRGASDFVDEARRVVEAGVRLPDGSYLEWTGQFEHEARARRTLRVIVPVVVVLVFLILYATYRDFADAALMLCAVPGAVAGGVFLQWLLGYRFSVTVWVGYIACIGMATSTGIIMLVYLRGAVARAGGIENLNAEGLRRAVLDGAAHRLRPKLLTEGVTILGLAPLLWATGVGAEVLKPMAAPVIGGLLVADEVIDLLLPVLFFQVRRRRLERLESRRESIDLSSVALPAPRKPH